MMQKEEFENYKHMIVSEQPIFHDLLFPHESALTVHPAAF